MACYVVTRHLPGITPEALTSAGLRAKTCSVEMTDEGTPVKWLRSFFIPEKEQTHCYFEADNRDVVKEVNERANIPFNEIHEVQELVPDAV
ncbi:DUF4242 domain-containing protein [Kaarinaea lacus]